MTATIEAAARNNAAWCDLMCRAHGGTGAVGADAWTTPTRSPEYYPDAVTLAADADSELLLARVDTSRGCSVKDSFAMLDLSAAGFRVLFDSTWIGRARAPVPSSPDAWQPVTTAPALLEWEAAWAHPEAPAGRFPPALLAEPDVVVLGGPVGGAVLNHHAGCVGVSNLFTRRGNLDAAWRTAIHTAHARFPNVPIVGYESGDDLAAARRYGFVALGPLRVWVKD